MISKELINDPVHFIKLSDNFTWDKKQEQLLSEGKNIALSEKEHRLLKLFIRYKGNPVSYEKITIAVWDDAYDRDVSIDSIKNQVSQLRKKISNIRIASVYGEGYILR